MSKLTTEDFFCGLEHCKKILKQSSNNNSEYFFSYERHYQQLAVIIAEKLGRKRPSAEAIERIIAILKLDNLTPQKKMDYIIKKILYFRHCDVNIIDLLDNIFGINLFKELKIKEQKIKN